MNMNCFRVIHVISSWLQVGLVAVDSFGWVVADGFGWFWVVCCFSSYDFYRLVVKVLEFQLKGPVFETVKSIK